MKNKNAPYKPFEERAKDFSRSFTTAPTHENVRQSNPWRSEAISRSTQRYLEKYRERFQAESVAEPAWKKKEVA